MCVIVDGYKLYRVFDASGIQHEVAGIGNDDAVSRAHLRGINDAQYARWHEMYREYAHEHDAIERSALRVLIKSRIYHDIALYP